MCGLNALAKKSAYVEPSGYNGKKLGTACYFVTHQDQAAKWRHRVILSVVSNKHLGKVISKETHLKTC